MPRYIEGILSAKALKFGIVVSRFNSFITDRLFEGAIDAFLRAGGEEDSIDIVKVPGAFEIPSMAKRLVVSGKYDGVICLGAVIRGSTPHFEYIATQVTKGVAEVAMYSEVPVIYGVLTTDTIEQAIERAGTKTGNKGWDATMAAIEMANLLSQLR
ncbi:MAG: 6,7-dimethyl-8-ribityllumazine synthase [Thermodesulfobacteriota bacterium]|nr:6,7-dimethyl-8-ribityllumazine synthase [Thermodesulfobacteriota bacterium]